jgi:hypothetical protein
MSFKLCIQNAIAAGSLSEEKGRNVMDEFDRALEQARLDGMEEGAAHGHAADEAFKATTKLNADKRVQKIHQMQRASELWDRLHRTDKPNSEMINVLQDLDLNYRSVQGMLRARLNGLIEKYSPKKAGWQLPVRDLDNIVYESYEASRGRGDPESQQLADAIKDTIETARNWANMYGATIEPNPHYIIPQKQDAVKARAVSEDTWVRDHLEHSDWSIMRSRGLPIPPAQREQILREMWRGIISDGFDDPAARQTRGITLINRLDRDRFLYYKDAGSWLAMQKKYGTGNVYEQIIHLTDSMARDISLLKVLGPNPDSMKEFVKAAAGHRASEIDIAANPGKRVAVDAVERKFTLYDNMYKLFTHKIASTQGNWGVNLIATVRTVAANAMLGGSLIPSVGGDLANSKTAAMLFKVPEMKIMREYLDGWVDTRETRNELAVAGITIENALPMIYDSNRFYANQGGAQWAHRMGDIVYRMGLAQRHTTIIRDANAKLLMGQFANMSGRSFDDLPFAGALAEVGVTEKDWNAFRATPHYEIKGARFLRPIDMWEAGTITEKKAAEKFQNFLNLYLRTAVPSPDLRVRVAMGEAIDPNSMMGQLARTFTSLTAFSTSILFGPLKRIAAAPGIINKSKLIGAYGGYTFMAGAAITQIKAMLYQGQNPYSYDDPEFYMKALLNGGTFGILGDFVANNTDLTHGNFLQIGSPLTDALGKVAKLTVMNPVHEFQGKETHFAKDAMDALATAVPNFWYTRLLFEREVKDYLMQEGDPAAYARRQQYLQQHKEGMWWEPGQQPTSPDLTTVGGSE